jgi:aminoglycoside/choline kinase family phosphotransferase
MTDRGRAIAGFLASAGWAGAARAPLAGDASARRYERLALGGRRAVLMDAPPGRGEDTARFTRVGRWLRARGYSAPEIYAEDHGQGLLLLEDLGDALAARLVAADPALEAEIYTAATGFLADLHRHAPPDFAPRLDGAALADLTAILPEWYLPGIGAARTPELDALPGQIAALHDRLTDGQVVMSMRDFHSENLIWLPLRSGCARLGLLDFQDAVATHPAYDLVSLLQDARRDVPASVERAMLAHYTAIRGLDPVRFAAIYALLGAQRALRIIGIFARLALRDGKTSYPALMPRVWAALERNLANPALAELAGSVRAGLPAPTPERIGRLKGQAG